MNVKYYQPTTTVNSPCVRNCCLNQEDVCLGCFRHIDEIMAWSQLDLTAKQNILNLCEQRQQEIKKIER